MGLINQFWDFIHGTNKEGPESSAVVVPYDYTQLYDALYDLYKNDDAVVDGDTTRRLRTVVNRSVEFYASKIMPGDIGISTTKRKVVKKLPMMTRPDVPMLPTDPSNPNPDPPPPVDTNPGTMIQETENVPLKEALQQIIKSSNLGNNKAAMLRGFALYGDSFVRVRGDNEKTYLEDVSPFFVTDFGENSRGFLTYIRIDIPIITESDVEAQTGFPGLYTEFWDNDQQLYQSWVTLMSPRTPIKQLGTPKEEIKFSELGIDFIPIVHTKFKDDGDKRGLSCVYHALDKIYEANRIATRLHDLLFAFGEPIFVASANDKDAAGRPLPPPKIATGSNGTATSSEAVKESIFGRLISLPGVASLNALIPNIDYGDALLILNAQIKEIEEDLPELRWYSLSEGHANALSGVAIRSLLGAAIDRVNEARTNFMSSVSRMLEMALTIGIFNGVFPSTLGNFDNGDFEHELEVDDAWGQTIDDKAASMAALTSAGIPAPAAMKLAGFTDIQITEAFPKGNQPPQPPQLPKANPFQKGQNGQNLPSMTMVNGKPAIKVN